MTAFQFLAKIFVLVVWQLTIIIDVLQVRSVTAYKHSASSLKTKTLKLSQGLGNCNIDFFIFHHPFHVMSLSFPKFKRVLNVAKKN